MAVTAAPRAGSPGDAAPSHSARPWRTRPATAPAGAETAYRQLAALTSDRAERIRLVDAGNAVRRRTLR